MNKTTEFFNQVSKASRASGNGRARIYADRARQAIVEAYWKDEKTGEMVERFKIDPAVKGKADKLVEMGFGEAINGKGRFLLDK